MLFNTDRERSFFISETIFLDDGPFFADSTISSILTTDEASPYGCTGIDENKITAIKKGFSESLDRRANLLYKSLPIQNLKTYSLLEKRIEYISSKYAFYQVGKERVDSTGTAAHPIGKCALEKALFELLQKNSLFILWYGYREGKILKTSDKDYTYLVDDTFSPVLTVLCINFKKDMFTIGLGTSTDIKESMIIAKNENILITNLKNFKANNNNYFKYFKGVEQRCHLKNKIDLIEKIEVDDIRVKQHTDVLNNLPTWLYDLRAYIIPQTISQKFNILTVKLYSSQLYLSVPRKIDLNLEKDINKFTLNLNKERLAKIPEMPML